MNKPLINAPRFITQDAESFQAHLRSIINHTARLRTKRKAKAKERAKYNDQFKEKPAPKYWSWRINNKGTGIITIRKRKPKYLLESEYQALLSENPSDLKLIQETLAKKKIPIKPDPKEGKS